MSALVLACSAGIGSGLAALVAAILDRHNPTGD